MSNEFFNKMFSSAPVMAILRGLGPERTLEVANLAWGVGIVSVEVPIQSPRDLDTLAAVARAGRQRGLSVGAGTVVSVEHVRHAAACGAAFAVSPGMDPTVAAACQVSGLAHLPGVATASDIQRATQLGLTWVKAFPANLLGPAWLKAMAAPFPGTRFVATGGMDAHNAPEYLEAGAGVVAVGSALEDPRQLELLSHLTSRPGGTPTTDVKDEVNEH